ncbi:MAG: DUF2625 family protein [Tepidisphaera sp.]|nr:DUF2625 family protein [Tepidisphaera sp.]
MKRTADELLRNDDPAWPAVALAIQQAGSNARLLPGAGEQGRRCIEAMQVSSRSTLGALAFHAGGILLDSGWVRILGCGHQECALSLESATSLLGFARLNQPPVGVVVGVDILGGIFAINGGFLQSTPLGQVAYFSPETLEWTGLGVGHTAWVQVMLSEERRDKFYTNVRWSGWREEVAALPANAGLAFYPFLWSLESRPLERTSRTQTPIDQLIRFHLEARP